MIKVNGHRQLSYIVFMNDKDKMIGYQLSKDSLDELKVKSDSRPPDESTPKGTRWVVKVTNCYSNLVYSKIAAADEEVTLEEYEIASNYDLEKKADAALQELKRKAISASNHSDGKFYCVDYEPVSATYGLSESNCMVCTRMPNCADYADYVGGIC